MLIFDLQSFSQVPIWLWTRYVANNNWILLQICLENIHSNNWKGLGFWTFFFDVRFKTKDIQSDASCIRRCKIVHGPHFKILPIFLYIFKYAFFLFCHYFTFLMSLWEKSMCSICGGARIILLYDDQDITPM